MGSEMSGSTAAPAPGLTVNTSVSTLISQLRLQQALIGWQSGSTIFFSGGFCQGGAIRTFSSTAVSPDFLLDYYAATETRIEVTTISRYTDNPAYQYSGGRLRRVYGRQYQDTTAYEYEQGTLILDIVDPASNRLIWRASAQAEVDRRASQEKRDRRLAEAVARMLARLPTD